MNKIKSYLVAAGLLMVPFVAIVPSDASALTCTITNTGAGSTNTCTSNDTYSCTVTNNNNIVVTGSNGQQAFSGAANVSSNGAGGSAQSGTVTNSNGTTFDVIIDNGNCVAAAVVTPTTPVTPVTPTAPQTPAVTAPNASKPTVLATTNGSSIAIIVAAIVAAGAVTFGGLRLARHLR